MRLEVRVAIAVALERLAACVVGEAVDLDDQPLLWPQSVHLVARDADVRARARELGHDQQREQATFGL
jgi:hypothetical protein